jgi:ADP-ribose pyrophosphatase
MARAKTQIEWEGKSWRLRVGEVERPDGVVVERGYIEHPGAVVLVPLLGEKVLMLLQYRWTVDEMVLELPAGTRGWDEDWLACAQRELREETGYQAESFISLGEVWAAPGVSDERMAIYLATELTPAPLAADFDELIEVEPVSLDKLVAMALDGRLEDAKSVVGILRAAEYLRVGHY